MAKLRRKKHSPAGKRYKRSKVVDTVGELVLGKERYKHSEERKKYMEIVTSSRRKLNKIRADINNLSRKRKLHKRDK